MSWLIAKSNQPPAASWYVPYLVAVAWLTGATVVRYLLDPLMGNVAPYGPYMAATIYLAWRYGFGPAMFNVLVGAVVATFLFVQPRYALFTIYGISNQLNTLIAVLLGVAVSLLSGSLRQAAAENARLYRIAKNAEVRKDEFLAMLSHELRNPLVPIRNALYVLEAVGARDPEVMAAGEIMHRQVEHLIRLVDDLLDVSRMTRGMITLKPETIPLSGIIDAAREISAPLISDKEQVLTVSLPPEPVFLKADRVRLTQSLANLLNNASRYTDKGGRIWLAASSDSDSVAIRVHDTGIGIAPENLARIFDLFEQADTARQTAQGGLGIGLTLARRLVEMHGGTIEARSPGPGLGSEFMIRLPVAPPPGVPARPPESVAPPIDSTRYRVLVVDDNEVSAQSVARVLKLWNHDVQVCHDGFSALEHARTFKPDVVLSDISLPRMDGYRLAHELRLLPGMEQVRLIAISGYGQPEDQRRSMEAGFEQHLLKPVAPEALAALLAELTPK
jgi:signal transduction histidine kinase/CheY-like chemotaxis protein